MAPLPRRPPCSRCCSGDAKHSTENSDRGWPEVAKCLVSDSCDSATAGSGSIVPRTPSRIRNMLDAQGLRQDQLVTFLTDGADDLAGFCEYMNHTADYVLGWFHIAMRFTVLTNTATSIWPPSVIRQKYNVRPVAGAATRKPPAQRGMKRVRRPGLKQVLMSSTLN